MHKVLRFRGYVSEQEQAAPHNPYERRGIAQWRVGSSGSTEVIYRGRSIEVDDDEEGWISPTAVMAAAEELGADPEVIWNEDHGGLFRFNADEELEGLVGDEERNFRTKKEQELDELRRAGWNDRDLETLLDLGI